MKVYKLSKKYLRKRYIMLSLAALVILTVSILPIYTDEEYPFILLAFAFLALLVFVIMPLIHLNYDLILDDKYIQKKHFLSGSKMNVEGIKEYKFEAGKLVIIPNKSSFIKIEVILGYEENDLHDIFIWLNKHTRNLAFEERMQQEVKEISKVAESMDFGASENHRIEKLIEAKKTARILNLLTIPILAWVIFYPHPLQIAIVVTAILPLIAVITIYHYKGLISLYENKFKGSVYPSLIFPILMFGVALALRSVLDYNISDHSNLWISLIGLTIVLTAIVFYATRKIHFETLKDYLKLASPLFIFAAYSYGLLTYTNCYFDTSTPTRYETKIVGKEEYNNKGRTSYRLTLEYWHNPKETINHAEVSYAIFRKVKKGDVVLIDENKGRLNIPHYKIARIVLNE